MNYSDTLIIGFGKGGKTLAQDLARQGEKVILIEKSATMYGGTCINIGCIPTKSLVHNAKLSEHHTDWNFEQKAQFFRQSVQEKKELVGLLRQKNYSLLSDNQNITVITGEASFVDEKTVKVTLPDGSESLFSAPKIIINTGAREFVPPIKGINGKNVFTSTTLLDNELLPKTLCIIGGGYIGLEFASMFASFGSEVTVLERGKQLIAREDRDVAEAVQKRLEKRGIRFVFEADTTEIKSGETENTVFYRNISDEKVVEIRAEAVLIATGRRPNTEVLNLELAGIALTERGGIKTNEFLQTSQPHIWALGDVAGNEQFTYISLDDSRIVLDFINGNQQKSISKRNNVPYSVFIDPPLSRVGLSEQEATSKGIDYEVSTLSVGAIPRARLLNETDGLLKLLVSKSDGKIIGCTLFCVDSHEVINFVSAAMKLGADYTFLRDFIFTHPTISEALNDLGKQISIKK